MGKNLRLTAAVRSRKATSKDSGASYFPAPSAANFDALGSPANAKTPKIGVRKKISRYTPKVILAVRTYLFKTTGSDLIPSTMTIEDQLKLYKSLGRHKFLEAVEKDKETRQVDKRRKQPEQQPLARSSTF